MKTHQIAAISLITLTLLAGPALAQRGGGGGRGAGGGGGRDSIGQGSSAGRMADQTDFSRAQQRQQAVDRAQKTPPGLQVSLAERLQKQTQLSRELGLTSEQQAAVVRIREQERNEVRTINQKRLTTKAKKESRVREAVEKRNQEIREILTPEQRAKLDQMMMKRAGDRDQVRDRDQTRTQTPPDE